MKLSFELDNGNTLEGSQMDDNFFSGLLALQTFSDWKPNEKKDIKRLVSESIPIEYINYPIKKVIANFILETDDQINQETNEITVASFDVTNKWQRAVEKTKKHEVDGDDVHYEDQIFRGKAKNKGQTNTQAPIVDDTSEKCSL